MLQETSLVCIIWILKIMIGNGTGTVWADCIMLNDLLNVTIHILHRI